MSQPELITVAELAERLGVSRNRVRKLAQLRGTGTRYGQRIILFTPEDVANMQPKPVGKPVGWRRSG